MVSDNVPIPITMEVSALQAVALELVLDQNKSLKKNDFFSVKSTIKRKEIFSNALVMYFTDIFIKSATRHMNKS